MNKALRLLTFVITAVLFSFRCDQPFDANGPVDQHLVVFTILSTDRSTQIVRVTAPFLTSGSAPNSNEKYDNGVADATVELFIPPHYILDHNNRPYLVAGQVLYSRDTVLLEPNKNPPTNSIRVSALGPFVPQYGSTYTVTAISRERGSVSGSVKFPRKPTITAPGASRLVMNDPPRHDPNASIDFLVTFSDTVGGYAARLFLDYEVVRQGEWTPERVEIPISSTDPSSFNLADPIYPALLGPVSPKSVQVSFRNGYLRSVINKLVDDTYVGNPIIFSRLTLVLLQAERSLYSYVASAQLERDPRSVRLDQPPVARLSRGGYGLIGGYTLDSASYLLPEYFYANHR